MSSVTPLNGCLVPWDFSQHFLFYWMLKHHHNITLSLSDSESFKNHSLRIEVT